MVCVFEEILFGRLWFYCEFGVCSSVKSVNLEQDQTVACPYCGEEVAMVINSTIASQDFVEDCQVCCRPIQFQVSVDQEGEIFDFRAKREEE